MKKITKGIIYLLVLSIGFVLGVYWNQFSYKDKCLDMGGGMNPGGYDICVVEKNVEK